MTVSPFSLMNIFEIMTQLERLIVVAGGVVDFREVCTIHVESAGCNLGMVSWSSLSESSCFLYCSMFNLES